MSASPPRNPDVFLNIPYDQSYENLFVALIVSVVAARMVPRCAIEIPGRGESRLERIMRLLDGCQSSIHDLSRSERFNMPFELGLAVALRQNKKHEIILLESRQHRLAKRLSDIWLEPLIHGNGSLKLIAVVTDNLGDGPKLKEVEGIYRKLVVLLPRLKRDYRTTTIFTKSIFQELVSGAMELSEEIGIL